MGYKQWIHAGLDKTKAMLGVQQEEIDTDLSRRQGIDQLLRTLVRDQDLLDFLTARDASAALVFDPEYGPLSDFGCDPVSLRKDGSVVVQLRSVLKSGYRTGSSLYDLIKVPRGFGGKVFGKFIDRRGFAFVCSPRIVPGTSYALDRVGDFLAARYNGFAFRDQTAEAIRRNLDLSLELILQRPK